VSEARIKVEAAGFRVRCGGNVYTESIARASWDSSRGCYGQKARLDSGEVNPAKTSSTRVFSGSRCGQTPCLKTLFGWATTQGGFLRASIPYLKIEKKQKKEKSGSKNGRN
jgi:hypothetical protein